MSDEHLFNGFLGRVRPKGRKVSPAPLRYPENFRFHPPVLDGCPLCDILGPAVMENACAEQDLGPSPLREYRFDVEMTATVRVMAPSREAADKMIRNMDCSDPADLEYRGVQLTELTSSEWELFQVDGEDVNDDGTPLEDTPRTINSLIWAVTNGRLGEGELSKEEHAVWDAYKDSLR